MDSRVKEIVGRALEGKVPSYDEVVFLLGVDEASPEATYLRGTANDIAREKTGNSGVIWGQIGVEMYPCEGDCRFCSFAKSSTFFTDHVVMPVEEVVHRAKEFAKGGDLYGMCLMTMNTFDEEHFLEVCREVRKAIPTSTILTCNVGQTTKEYFEQLKAVGVDAAYHVKRIGEGTLTKFAPEEREACIQAAHDAGLRIIDCCEPVGAETTDEEIATRMMEIVERGHEMGIYDCSGVMKRNSVPGTCFEGLDNEITDLRMATISAVQVLTMVDQERFPWIGIHEPNTVSLLSGGNYLCAESGFNPRDTAEDTAGNHGLDVPMVRQMFYQAGFRYLTRGDGTRVELTADYMDQKIREGMVK